LLKTSSNIAIRGFSILLRAITPRKGVGGRGMGQGTKKETIITLEESDSTGLRRLIQVTAEEDRVGICRYSI
jgi:hypothetical protein